MLELLPRFSLVVEQLQRFSLKTLQYTPFCVSFSSDLYTPLSWDQVLIGTIPSIW